MRMYKYTHSYWDDVVVAPNKREAARMLHTQIYAWRQAQVPPISYVYANTECLGTYMTCQFSREVG